MTDDTAVDLEFLHETHPEAARVILMAAGWAANEALSVRSENLKDQLWGPPWARLPYKFWHRLHEAWYAHRGHESATG